MLVGFIGAPSCGKSTTAFGLCYHLKQQGYAVEFFPEYARMHIMLTRLEGGVRNGGLEGQKIIYQQDIDSADFYRANTDGIAITDGSSVNCRFYGLDQLDLAAEAARYDLLFYVPCTVVPPSQHDRNRVENHAEILMLAQQWDDVIRPLLGIIENVIELPGYPHYNCEEMATIATRIILKRYHALKQVA